VVSALAFSCDVYFYQVGGGYEPIGYEGLGQTNMARYSEMFGLGRATGIDIPGEGEGLVPTPKWKRLNYAETWVTGDSYNMSIGQGFVLATPLQMVNAYAAFANGGTLYRPHLVKEIRSPQKELIMEVEPEVIGELQLSEETKKWVSEGLRGVVDWGTAKDIIVLPGIPVSAKTGTAEFCDRYPQCLDRDGRVKTSHAWVVAFAPSNDPQIAVVSFVYNGGEGSLVSGPVVNAILRYYFGLDQPAEDETEDEETPDETGPAAFTARFLGSDTFPGPTAALSGFVLNAQGEGLPDVTINLLMDGEVQAQTVTGPTGQFDYNTIDPQIEGVWQIELADYSARPLTLEVSPGVRYLLEFEAVTTDGES
jgi:membrane peptidoglycan carboxypeptidase